MSNQISQLNPNALWSHFAQLNSVPRPSKKEERVRAWVIGLGHEMAGVFSNNDKLCKKFINAAMAEGEGAWRMPLAPAYDKLLKSRIADVKNVGSRAAGSITAGQFLQRFVKDDMPWVHLDIAGVASIATESAFSPKGATGWGVRALNRMIADHYEPREDTPGG